MRSSNYIKLKLQTSLLLLVTFCATGQPISGKVIDGATKIPLAYVNIGILGSPIGTISNEDGTFSIFVPSTYNQDSIIFSMLGYERRVIPTSQITAQENITIHLDEKATKLETVTVKGNSKKEKTFPLGNRYNQGGLIYCDSIAAGSAMALLIENKYPAYHKDLKFPVYAREARLFISRNTLDSFKVRIRFLSKNPETGLPDDDLFDESIVLNSSTRHGWIEFDLKPYKLLINDTSFFLAFEWIMDDHDRLSLLKQYYDYRMSNPNLVTSDTTIISGEKVGVRNYYQFQAGTSFAVSAIPFSLQNYTCYYRLNSFGKWMRAPGILTARLLVARE